MRHRIFVGLALLVGCTTRIPDEGTFVGNPGKAMLRVASAHGLDFEQVQLPDGAITPFDCDGVDGQAEDVTGVDLDNALHLPAGAWCGLRLELDADTLFDAVGADDALVHMELEIGTLELTSAAPVQTQSAAWVLELAEPGWTNATDLGAEGGKTVEVGPHDTIAEEPTQRVLTRSGIFEDIDRDGVIDDSERQAGPRMSAE